MDNAYNVDVTLLDPSKYQMGWYVSGVSDGAVEIARCYKTESSHGWPIEYYSNTITGNVLSDYEGFGWTLSLEGGLFDVAETTYHHGNNPAYVLGTPGPCSQNPIYATVADYSTRIDFLASAVKQSSEGLVQKFENSAVHLFSGSPVWLATVVNITNAINLVSFDAEFTSAEGAHGLLSVYWDTNMIGLLDEAAVRPGLQHYDLPCLYASADTSHVLGFHLDPFTSTQSSVLVTNVSIGFSGVNQPFSLTITTGVMPRAALHQLCRVPDYAAWPKTTVHFQGGFQHFEADLNGIIRGFPRRRSIDPLADSASAPGWSWWCGPALFLLWPCQHEGTFEWFRWTHVPTTVRSL